MVESEIKELNRFCKSTTTYLFPENKIKILAIVIHGVIVLALVITLFTVEIDKENTVDASYTVTEKNHTVFTKRSGYLNTNDVEIGSKVDKGQELFYIAENQPGLIKSSESINVLNNIQTKRNILESKIVKDKLLIDMLSKKKGYLALVRANSLRRNNKTLKSYIEQINNYEHLIETMSNGNGYVSLVEKSENMNLLLELNSGKRKIEKEIEELSTESIEEIELLESINESEHRIAITQTQISDLEELRTTNSNNQITRYASPTDGIVNSINYKSGDYVEAGSAVYSISTNDTDVVEGYLTPNQAAETRVGQVVLVKFANYSVHEYGRHFAKLEEITPQRTKTGSLRYYFKAELIKKDEEVSNLKPIPFTNGLDTTVTLILKKRLLITLILEKYTNWADWQ